ncbi:type II toxin-antitoxin system HipA family toxin [Ancylomarina sp. 16SWW S1-10-2]|uniref:type II toxin-antitoxin system HipA family toxin n=1 Tax=Ancylomarina sp. 16SWW S1-10-2 TaxID=2499681 RepID=UPI0012AD5651|nr:type II toxin-antitoxin system HipA family toxin [Ancylomarina sp. 16SWW S1-10-2]MRT93412.1 type II toxin-antitoxin system HipA family toxin [Ancylomarina sp. 16SWW S1-10-2]
MTGIENVLVNFNLEGQSYEVGELVLNNRKIYFRYHSDFLKTGLNISPIKLPFVGEITNAEKDPFEGLYGIFNDSLPDGWGRLLLDRSLSSKGIDILSMTPLDRLAYVGENGMGALSYLPQQDGLRDFEKQLELDVIAREMTHVLKGESTEMIEELFTLGGSSGGARPKILVGFKKQTNELIHGYNQIPDDFEEWLIKFPSSQDNQEIAKIEYAYYQMALKAGIEMSECQLFQGKSNQTYFGTKRFDRTEKGKLHVHTASGLMHDNFRMSTMDYGHLMDCAFRLERHVNAYEKIFRLAAFNVYAHNRDDHSKNFSFLMNAQGNWKMAPAYDLTYSTSAYGLHNTMIAGESKNPGETHLLKLANHFGLKKPESILEQVKEAISQWRHLAQDCGISKQLTSEIEKTFNRLNKN